jgi:predicted acetyltransferase
MRAALEEARRDGVALSSLYPAAPPLYRAAGYEAAGTRIVYRVDLGSLGAGGRDPDLRVVSTPVDEQAMHAAYDARVRPLCGPTDRARASHFWPRVFDAAEGDARAYLVEGEGGVEGYVVVPERPTAEQQAARELALRDIVALTPAAGARLIRFLVDHRSIWRTATFAGGPSEPLLQMSREGRRSEVTDLWRWMLRVLDVRAALEQRGWSPSVRGELHVEVRDPLLRENNRRWVLDVANGRAEVREGGSGSLTLDVRGLAALYSGYMPAQELRAAGLAAGEEEAIALASALFAGPAPWTPDFF